MDDEGRSRLDELAGRDTTSEKYIYYIGMGIAAVLLLLFLTMLFFAM